MTSDSRSAEPIDLQAYLRRLEYTGALEPTVEVLRNLHLAHVTHVPFENLDILLGQPIRLDLESLQKKIVGRQRGGYCFEQNLLFANVLREIGFPIVQLAARVRYRANRMLPRTHMLLLVHIDRHIWLADVGFGSEGLLFPIELVPEQEASQFNWTYRIVEDHGQWVLQLQKQDGWLDLYAFTLEPQHDVDYEIANYYTSTHPSSRFVQSLTVQLSSPTGRKTLRNREFIADSGTQTIQTMLADDDELLSILKREFGLTFPPGTRFKYKDASG